MQIAIGPAPLLFLAPPSLWLGFLGHPSSVQEWLYDPRTSPDFPQPTSPKWPFRTVAGEVGNRPELGNYKAFNRKLLRGSAAAFKRRA